MGQQGEGEIFMGTNSFTLVNPRGREKEEGIFMGIKGFMVIRDFIKTNPSGTREGDRGM